MSEVREMVKRNHKKRRRTNTEIPKMCPSKLSVAFQVYLRPKLSDFLSFLKCGNRIFFLLLINIQRV